MICFCSHKPIALIDANCLSQWYPSEFKVGNAVAYFSPEPEEFNRDFIFTTAEQYMMYRKALLFRDYTAAKHILNLSDPGEIKYAGRLVINFKEDEWNKYAMDIVCQGNMYKFGQNQHLQDYLLGTGDEMLVESAHYDKVWGTGLNEKDTRATPKDKWPGKNLLGKSLMKVRDAIKESTIEA